MPNAEWLATFIKGEPPRKTALIQVTYELPFELPGPTPARSSPGFFSSSMLLSPRDSSTTPPQPQPAANHTTVFYDEPEVSSDLAFLERRCRCILFHVANFERLPQSLRLLLEADRPRKVSTHWIGM